jgi:hypothetical protein
MWGALSDERTGLSYVRVIVSLMSIVHMYKIYRFKLLLQYIIQYIQGLCQSRLSTADHALLMAAPVTTTV